jgi:misacylated tRNA(Ala) deacylase
MRLRPNGDDGVFCFLEDTMTELLYTTDAYVQTFDAVVTAVTDDNGVILDRTAFYPGGGGQPNDEGTLAAGDQTWQVTRVKKVGGEVVHFVAGALPGVGTAVTGQLDWERRYKLMRTHTAMHILCGVVWRDYGASVTGGNMDPLQGRMDFEFETMRQELVAEIETAVNVEVDAARPTQVQILPRDEAFQIPDLIRTKINLLPEGISEVRTVELVGLDLQADGGTHVANTKEVGRMRITDYKSKGKINKRIYVELEG